MPRPARPRPCSQPGARPSPAAASYSPQTHRRGTGSGVAAASRHPVEMDPRIPAVDLFAELHGAGDNAADGRVHGIEARPLEVDVDLRARWLHGGGAAEIGRATRETGGAPDVGAAAPASPGHRFP